MTEHSDRIRALLAQLDMSQRGAARELGINERTMRDYCAAGSDVPRVVFLALERLIDIKLCAYCASREEV
jgi:hypothetical protein